MEMELPKLRQHIASHEATRIAQGAQIKELMAANALLEMPWHKFAEEAQSAEGVDTQTFVTRLWKKIEDQRRALSTVESLNHANQQLAVERDQLRSANEALPILRNCLGNLYVAVQRFAPQDADIQFAMREAGMALGPPYADAAPSASEE